MRIFLFTCATSHLKFARARAGRHISGTRGIWNSAFKHTAWSTSLSPREADDAGLAQFDFTRPVSRKNWHAHFRDQGWRRLRYLPPRKRGDVATETAVALDSNFKMLLMSRILVAVEKMVASCYNRECPARRDNNRGSLTSTIHTQSCLIP